MVLAPDITGQRFGRLTALQKAHVAHGNAHWLFQCDCGKQAVVAAFKARNGHTQSCGCVQREVTSKRVKRHGQSTAGGRQQSTRLYRIWSKMKARCSNPREINYDRYGGRGITVCEEWAGSFESFEAWAKSSGYASTLSIDRVDGEKSYSPENCRWATAQEQAANRGGRFAKPL